jgi:glycosyltransferase involved in cell wall biosynthesis
MDGAVLDSGAEAVPCGIRSALLSPRTNGPLKVGVLVDLTLTPDAGGHVKCWERIAEAATEFPDQLDLTVHFNAAEGASSPDRIELSPTVRYVLMPPVFSTRRLVSSVPDHTDLALWHPTLARLLPNYDVIHTTDAFFCYARTATRFARKTRVPVVSSIHTNTPEYARITVDTMLRQMFGDSTLYRLTSARLALPGRVSGLLERRLYRHLDRVTMAMASYGGALDDRFANKCCGTSLRRGFDRRLFNPELRDRNWLEARYGVPPGHFVVMYAGKLNDGKNAPFLAPVIDLARQHDRPIHLFCAGKGDQREALAARLGAAATFPGVLSQQELARAYASCDLFVFPSMIDEAGNAALEALASGLPALLAAGSGVATRMVDCPAVRVLPGDAPQIWADMVVEFAASPRCCRELGASARNYVETMVPSWAQVVGEDLLPVWQAAAAT